MTTMADSTRLVTGGVDTHLDVHVGAVLDELGRDLGTRSFPATVAGYEQLVGWMTSHGQLDRVGVEGTGSYGVGLARHLHDEGITVLEVNRPDRASRRRHGKSDPLDAIAAARAVLANERVATPKSHDGPIEAIRLLRLAKRSAIKARTQTANQIHAVVLTAPEPLREKFRNQSVTAISTAAVRLRPGIDLSDPANATKRTLVVLGRRWNHLNNEIRELEQDLGHLVTTTAPELIAHFGVGPDTAAALLIAAGDNPHRLHSEAAFAALCGVSPIPASSGKTTRHRLNRGGNRDANNALWRIVIVRMSSDPTTRDYVERRTKEGLSKREIIRCLKRYVARQLYPDITHSVRQQLELDQ